jgi:acetyl-CoA synthetase
MSRNQARGRDLLKRKPFVPDDLTACGVPADEAGFLAIRVNEVLRWPPVEAWREISQGMLRAEHPWAVHRLLFEAAFCDWDAGQGPAPAWTPTDEEIGETHVGRLMVEQGCASVADLHAWSVADRSAFWAHMIERLGICLTQPYSSVLDLSNGVTQPQWLSGAKLNIVESCFQAPAGKPAIEYRGEEEGVRSINYGELEALCNRVANGLRAAGFLPGDALAIYLPMTIESVAIYLGIVRAGCVAVSIADSLAAEEIAVRLRLSDAKGVFTQDEILRGGKRLPLYSKIVEAAGPTTIVICTEDEASLRSGDLAWKDFLSPKEQFSAWLADPDEPTNILFSSGTTGEPKAIPWTHVTPVKCAVDGYLHQDIHEDDRVAWPTNLGWMMGPWLIYAGLVNRATIALYGGAPTGRDFGQFVEDAQVTMLGVIPSLVKTWRASDCMRGLDWNCIRRFSSTGECSNPDDMLFLMSLAGYKPVIEYCGGTELGGGYIGSTMAQPNVPAVFSTPSFGTGLVQFNEASGDIDAGEVFLVPPAIGMSTRLLHHEHQAVYFDETPAGPTGETLRRHGDAMERLPGGYYRAQGRVDDTMNLGGIKVSSVEIERVLNLVPAIRETSAVAVAPPGGGPSMLWVFAVLHEDSPSETGGLESQLQQAIRTHLNPLFKIAALTVIESLPRTASHKIMRRLLRDQAVQLLNSAQRI